MSEKRQPLYYRDLVLKPKNTWMTLLMTKDPRIDKDVWEKSDINDLAHWTFHSSLFDKTIDKILANIATRLRARPIKRQIAFLKKYHYLSQNNLLLAAKIIKGLMKSPVKNFAIVKKLEESYFTTKEQRILLWISVYDGIPRNHFEKSYALFRACQLMPFATTVTLSLVKRTKEEKQSFEKLRIAA